MLLTRDGASPSDAETTTPRRLVQSHYEERSSKFAYSGSAGFEGASGKSGRERSAAALDQSECPQSTEFSVEAMGEIATSLVLKARRRRVVAKSKESMRRSGHSAWLFVSHFSTEAD